MEYSYWTIWCIKLRKKMGLSLGVPPIVSPVACCIEWRGPSQRSCCSLERPLMQGCLLLFRSPSSQMLFRLRRTQSRCSPLFCADLTIINIQARWCSGGSQWSYFVSHRTTCADTYAAYDLSNWMSSSDPWNAHYFLVLSTSSQFSFFFNMHYDDVILGGKGGCLGERASKRGSKDSFWEWGRKGMIGGIERWLVGGWEQGFLNF